jgi:hypothetical protein
MVMIVKVAILLLFSAANAFPNFPIAPSCGWNSCGTSFRGDRPDTSDDFVWLNIDMCNFIAYKKGTCCCFAGDIGVWCDFQSFMTAWRAWVHGDIRRGPAQDLNQTIKHPCPILVDPFGQTKEVATDHPDWVQNMTQMQAQEPNLVGDTPDDTMPIMITLEDSPLQSKPLAMVLNFILTSCFVCGLILRPNHRPYESRLTSIRMSRPVTSQIQSINPNATTPWAWLP